MNNLQTRFDDLNVDKLKTIPAYLKTLNDVVSKEVVKKILYNKLNTKGNNSENIISDVSTLILTNQYNTGKQTLEKKLVMTRIRHLMVVV